MRRTSLTASQAHALAHLLRTRREALGLSMRHVGAKAGCNIATMSVLESGTNLSPQANTLKAIAYVLALPISDVFVLVGWLPPEELPTLRPYLRSQYRGLTDRDIADIAAYAERLNQRHGGIAPTDREDELPE